LSPGAATTFQTFATISARISSATEPSLFSPEDYPRIRAISPVS
jgi:hypothetical protein